MYPIPILWAQPLLEMICLWVWRMNESLGPQKLNPILNFIAGTASGVTGLLVGYPFDTVKVRFQNPQMSQKYTSTLDALVTIVREERFVGLYKGVTSPLATAALLNGIIFPSYQFFLKLQLDHGEVIPNLTQVALAGIGSGIVISIITTPAELIKIRQQSSLTPTSTLQVAFKIYRNAGIPGLYRGWTITAFREVGYGAYFFAYEATLRFFSSQSFTNTSTSGLTVLLAGGIAGIAGWTATFPLDVVKTRMQGIPPPSLHDQQIPLISGPSLLDVNPYQTTTSTIIHSYRTEGVAGFFHGITPTIIRAFPVNMVIFATYETIVYAFS